MPSFIIHTETSLLCALKIAKECKVEAADKHLHIANFYLNNPEPSSSFLEGKGISLMFHWDGYYKYINDGVRHEEANCLYHVSSNSSGGYNGDKYWGSRISSCQKKNLRLIGFSFTTNFERENSLIEKYRLWLLSIYISKRPLVEVK